MLHLISAEPTTVSSSENSKETVIPSSSSVGSSPSVGPAPSADLIPEASPVLPSPSASCDVNPVRITSPVKMPVSVPVSTSL